MQRNAIEFAKKHQSVTYLVFSSKRKLVGYFTLTVKPITIDATEFSKSMQKKLSRVSLLSDNGTYSLASYLIAQFGKNFAVPKEIMYNGLMDLDHP